MNLTKEKIVLASPFLIILVNTLVALVFGKIIGKWSFILMILKEWLLWLFLF